MKKILANFLLSLFLLAIFPSITMAYPIYMGEWTSSNSTLYSVESTTGVQTIIGNTGISYIGGLAISGSGQLYGLNTSGSLYSINNTTAASSLVGNTGLSWPEGLTFGLDGVTLYGSGGGSLYSINSATAAATNLGSIGMSDVDGLTVAPMDVYCYVSILLNLDIPL